MEQRNISSQIVLVQMRVNLSGGDAFMAEHFLHGAEVGAAFDEVRGEGVTERVRTHRLVDARRFYPFLDEHEDHLAGEVRTSAVQEDVIFLSFLDFQLFTFSVNVKVYHLHGRRPNGNQSLFVAFAHHLDEAVVEEEVGEPQGH